MVGSATFGPKPGPGNQIIPARNGGRKSPTVPRKQTMINSQRNILSITMATYFQSSFTCRCKRAHSDRGQGLQKGRGPTVAGGQRGPAETLRSGGGGGQVGNGLSQDSNGAFLSDSRPVLPLTRPRAFPEALKLQAREAGGTQEGSRKPRGLQWFKHTAQCLW